MDITTFAQAVCLAWAEISAYFLFVHWSASVIQLRLNLLDLSCNYEAQFTEPINQTSIAGPQVLTTLVSATQHFSSLTYVSPSAQ